MNFSWVHEMQGADWHQNFFGNGSFFGNGTWNGNGLGIGKLKELIGFDVTPGEIRELIQLAQTDPAAAQEALNELCDEAETAYENLQNGGLQTILDLIQEQKGEYEQTFQELYTQYCINGDVPEEISAEDLAAFCAQAQTMYEQLANQWSDEAIQTMIDSYTQQYLDLKAQWCDNPNAVNDFLDDFMNRFNSRSGRMNVQRGTRGRVSHNQNTFSKVSVASSGFSMPTRKGYRSFRH